MRKWMRRAGVALLVLVGLLCVVVAWQWKGDASARHAEGAMGRASPSRFVDIDGMSVHYRDEGSGPPVVLVHGTGANLFTWDAWAAALSPSHRVVRLDLPAFALTGPRLDGRRPVRHVCRIPRSLRGEGRSQQVRAGGQLARRRHRVALRGRPSRRGDRAHPGRRGRLPATKTGRPLVFRLGRLRRLCAPRGAPRPPSPAVERTLRLVRTGT